MTELERALDSAGWDDLTVEHLNSAFERSDRYISEARDYLRDQLQGTDASLDVVAFGSLARREMTVASDLDWLVVVHALPKDPGAVQQVLSAADGLRRVIGDEGDIRQPGASGVFGQMVSAVELVEVIGLQADTNHSHTRRILLIEESVSLRDETLHRNLLTATFRRYLDAHPPARTGVPRFLLNDLLRYWRTLTIDYQAKSPARSMYSLRYLKLIVSRKLTFAASLLPLLALAERGKTEHADDFAEVLTEVYSQPALIRFVNSVAQLSQDSPELVELGKDVLRIADKFNGLVGDPEWRSRVDEASRAGDTKDQPDFAEARRLGSDLQDKLEEMFFTGSLLPLTRRLLVF